MFILNKNTKLKYRGLKWLKNFKIVSKPLQKSLKMYILLVDVFILKQERKVDLRKIKRTD